MSREFIILCLFLLVLTTRTADQVLIKFALKVHEILYFIAILTQTKTRLDLENRTQKVVIVCGCKCVIFKKDLQKVDIFSVFNFSSPFNRSNQLKTFDVEVKALANFTLLDSSGYEPDYVKNIIKFKKYVARKERDFTAKLDYCDAFIMYTTFE